MEGCGEVARARDLKPRPPRVIPGSIGRKSLTWLGVVRDIPLGADEA